MRTVSFQRFWALTICIDKTAKVAFFDAKPRDFFKRDIYKLIKRWKMIVENGGECINKGGFLQ